MASKHSRKNEMSTSPTVDPMFQRMEISLLSEDDEDSDAEENKPLSIRIGFRKNHSATAKKVAVAVVKTLILNTGESPREQVERLFTHVRNEIAANPACSEDQAALLADYRVHLDAGTRRRGVCKYTSKTIGISSALVEGGISDDHLIEILRHELSHAANPGAKHGPAWKAFYVAIGGNGERCDKSDESRAAVGHKIEIYCPVGGPVKDSGHLYAKRHVAPTAKFLASKCCRKCLRESKVVSRLVWKRV